VTSFEPKRKKARKRKDIKKGKAVGRQKCTFFSVNSSIAEVPTF